MTREDVRCQILPRLAHVCLSVRLWSGITITNGSTNYCTNITTYVIARVLALRWIVCFRLALLVIAGRVETDHVVMVAAAVVVANINYLTTRWTWVASRWVTQQ
jgi:uncharacterized membrane protein